MPARAIGCDLVGPLEQLGVYPVAHNQPINAILTGASALVTSDAQHGQLPDDVAECDRAVARHHNHPSARNARSPLRLETRRSPGAFQGSREALSLVFVSKTDR